jgi:hypothetical protein
MNIIESENYLHKLGQYLKLDPNLASIYDISSQVQHYEHHIRENLLAICNSAFNSVSSRKDEITRVACARVMVALVPDSIESIKYWINKITGEYIYEVHFSLFCLLDVVPELPNGKMFAKEIPLIVEKYLMDIKSDTAHAAFIAGDLLGDHWHIAEALPVLIRLAQEARYIAGRSSAIHGLSHILSRLPASHSITKDVVSLLAKISIKDPSNSVRLSAKLALDNKKFI